MRDPSVRGGALGHHGGVSWHSLSISGPDCPSEALALPIAAPMGSGKAEGSTGIPVCRMGREFDPMSVASLMVGCVDCQGVFAGRSRHQQRVAIPLNASPLEMDCGNPTGDKTRIFREGQARFALVFGEACQGSTLQARHEEGSLRQASGPPVIAADAPAHAGSEVATMPDAGKDERVVSRGVCRKRDAVALDCSHCASLSRMGPIALGRLAMSDSPISPRIAQVEK